MTIPPNNYGQSDTGIGAVVIDKNPIVNKNPMDTFYRVDNWVKNNEYKVAAQRAAQQKKADDLMNQLKLNTNGIYPADKEVFIKANNELYGKHAEITKAKGIGYNAHSDMLPEFQNYQTLANASIETNKHIEEQLKQLADATKGDNNLDVDKTTEAIKQYGELPLVERAKLGKPSLLVFKSKTINDYWREGSKDLKPSDYVVEDGTRYEKGKKIGAAEISRTMAKIAMDHPEYENLIENEYRTIATNPKLKVVADQYAKLAEDKKFNPLGLDVHFMPELYRKKVLMYVQPTDYDETPKAKAEREINTAATKEKQKLTIKDKHDMRQIDMPNLMKQMTGRSDYWVLDDNNRPTRIPTELEVGRDEDGAPIYATSVKVNDNNGVFSYTYTTSEKVPGTQPTENADGTYSYSSTDPIKMNQDLLDMLELNSNQKIKVVQEFNDKKAKYGGLSELVKNLSFEEQGVKTQTTPNVLGREGKTSTGDKIIQGKTKKIVVPD